MLILLGLYLIPHAADVGKSLLRKAYHLSGIYKEQVSNCSHPFPKKLYLTLVGRAIGHGHFPCNIRCWLVSHVAACALSGVSWAAPVSAGLLRASVRNWIRNRC